MSFTQGTYRFDIFHDEGACMYIDGEIVFEDWCDNCRQTDSIIRTLTAGLHNLKLDMWENIGWAGAQLTWGIYEPGSFNKDSPNDGAFSVSSSPTLSWTSSNGATSYEYYVDTTDNDICDSSWINVGNETSIGLSSLSFSTPYVWQVRAINANAITEADAGDWWLFTTEEPSQLPGITVIPTSGLVTTEAGGSDTFTVVLDSQPTANVSIGLSSSDTYEGTVSASSLTFTPTDWYTPQPVTVTGVNDEDCDSDFAYTIITNPATSADRITMVLMQMMSQ